MCIGGVGTRKYSFAVFVLASKHDTELVTLPFLAVSNLGLFMASQESAADEARSNSAAFCASRLRALGVSTALCCFVMDVVTISKKSKKSIFLCAAHDSGHTQTSVYQTPKSHQLCTSLVADFVAKWILSRII